MDGIYAPFQAPFQRYSQAAEPMFYYFAYGSCMCPVDLKRTLGESTHLFVVGPATLSGYRLGFYRRSARRNCGVLDVVSDPASVVHGVLYALPWRLSDRLDEREEVPTGGYRRETIEIHCNHQLYTNVRTYVVVNKLDQELAPNDWYFNVVLRGAVTCGLPEQYCWQLFEHMHQLQQHHRQLQEQLQRRQPQALRSA
ncbi:MAG: gamma-glutamylcyclotransferase [Lyngbya sp. HA4199-MV5]|nr:gamma-glutamylcyclotransferase [Lyngbya sp. HA4199-MV5]